MSASCRAPPPKPTRAAAEDTELEFERRPRAVLAADVVGYTRLMEAAELQTHNTFRRLRVGLIDPMIVAHRGTIVKNTGDGYIAVFETALDAIRCARVLQHHVRDQERQKPAPQRIEFRMGIHWEPVIFDLDDVYGHGVNIAARLQEAAPPGGIVISSALQENIADVPDCTTADLGALRFKNLSHPVHAFLIREADTEPTASDSLLWMSRTRATPPSIAILPFNSVTPDPDDFYFAEGFIEDIIASLSGLRDLLTVSRGSTMAFRQRSVDPVEVGEKLGVQYFVAGRFSRSGSKARLWVELIDVTTASVLWSEKYDLGISEIFELQDEIVFQIVGHIVTGVRQAEVKRALRKAPQSLTAYDYFLQALDKLYRLDFNDFIHAKLLLQKAMEEDPEYAAPFAFAAHWQIFNIGEGWSSNVQADSQEIIRLTNCAIERDPSNSLAFAIQGHAKAMFFRENEAAIDYVDQATTISPSNSWAWTFSSGPYGFVGRSDAGIIQAENAIRLSPIDPHGALKVCFLAQNHYLSGHYGEAARWARRSLTLNSRLGTAARVLAASLVATGQTKDAKRVAEGHNQALPGFSLVEYSDRCPFQADAAALYVERLREAGISP